MKKLLLALIVLLPIRTQANTPPQVINKICSVNQYFNKIAPGSGNITCAQPTYSGILNTPTFADSLAIAAGVVTLVNDSASPGASKYYGTNGSSVLGFFAVPSITEGNLTEATSSVLTISGGTSAVIGSGTSIQVKQSGTSQSGYLSNTDWNTFNGKQGAGSYLTALTGDGTAAGPGSSALTLATVNANVGTFAVETVNGKGLVTAASNLSGDATSSGAALTLATVNTNVGSFGSASSSPNFTVNGKGLLTAAGSSSIQVAESQVTNLVSDLAGKQATGNYITALTSDVTASGPGSSIATIANNAVTNAKAAQMTANTLKGNNTGSTANAADLSTTQVHTLLGDLLANGSVALSSSWNMGPSVQVSLGGTAGSTGIFSINPSSAQNPLSAVNQRAEQISMTSTSAATSETTGVHAAVQTAAASYTTGFRAEIYADPSGPVGAGSAITNDIDLLAPVPTSGSNNAILADTSNFSGNWALNLASTNASFFSGPIFLGGTTTSTLMNVGGTSLLSNTSQFGFQSQFTSNSTATAFVGGFFVDNTTAASTTVANVANFRSGSIAVGPSGTVTRFTGFYDNGAAVHHGTNNALLADNIAYTGNYFINESGTDPSSFAGLVTSSAGFSTPSSTNSATTTPVNNLALNPFTRMTGSATITLNGIAAGTDGQIIRIANITGNSMTIDNNSVSATGSVILCPSATNQTLHSAAVAELIYDSTSTAWRLVSFE